MQISLVRKLCYATLFVIIMAMIMRGVSNAKDKLLYLMAALFANKNIHRFRKNLLLMNIGPVDCLSSHLRE